MFKTFTYNVNQSLSNILIFMRKNMFSNNVSIFFFQAQSDDDDVADEASVNMTGPDDFMTEFFAEVSFQIYF